MQTSLADYSDGPCGWHTKGAVFQTGHFNCHQNYIFFREECESTVFITLDILTN